MHSYVHNCNKKGEKKIENLQGEIVINYAFKGTFKTFESLLLCHSFINCPFLLKTHSVCDKMSFLTASSKKKNESQKKKKEMTLPKKQVKI